MLAFVGWAATPKPSPPITSEYDDVEVVRTFVPLSCAPAMTRLLFAAVSAMA
jgi:hypothetical protein